MNSSDNAGPRLGVGALAVPRLAHLERGCHVHHHEAAEGLDHRPHLLAHLVVGGDGRADGDAAVLADLRPHVADAPDVDVAVLAREAELRRQVLRPKPPLRRVTGRPPILEQSDR